MTSLLWNAKTGEARAVAAEPAAAVAPARQLCAVWRHCSSHLRRSARRARWRRSARRRRVRPASCAPCDVTAPRACAARSTAHYASHAKLLNLGQCSSRYKKPTSEMYILALARNVLSIHGLLPHDDVECKMRLPVARSPGEANVQPRAAISESHMRNCVEAQFQLHPITSQTTKYLHVVSSLPAELADELEDILAAPATSNQYDLLKAAILARKTPSERSRLQHLLNMEELGYQCPSQLLRGMRQLMGDVAADADTSLLRELFLQRLPHSMVPILAAAEDTPLDVGELGRSGERVLRFQLLGARHILTTAYHPSANGMV
ncbi:hypothetical protein ISCGN_007075 [Ixodes scapularis]